MGTVHAARRRQRDERIPVAALVREGMRGEMNHSRARRGGANRLFSGRLSDEHRVYGVRGRQRPRDEPDLGTRAGQLRQHGAIRADRAPRIRDEERARGSGAIGVRRQRIGQRGAARRVAGE